MNLALDQILNILKSTPEVLSQSINSLSQELLNANEGLDTWSPYQVVGHLIHGEKTDWVPRIKIIVSDQIDKTFTPYDRFAQNALAPKPVGQLLTEFAQLRNDNLTFVKSLQLSGLDLKREGMHPDLGKVTLGNLLSTWAVHDLSHLAQINRTVAKQFKAQMGPWPAYFSLLNNS